MALNRAKAIRKKGRYAAFSLIAAFILSVMVFSTTAYAKSFPEDEYGEEYEEYTAYYAGTEIIIGEEITIPALPIDPAPEQTQPPTLPTAPQTLTPPGNLTLVDDFSGHSAADKQFITVVTRNGHFFYIVIDRAGDRQNVHFLNQVSEYDLWEILEEDSRRTIAPAPVEPMPETITDPEPEAEPENGGGIGGILVMLLLLGIGGGGAYYYFKVRPQQTTQSAAASEIDEFVFDEDEEDYGGGMDFDEMDEGAGHDIDTDSNNDFDDMPDFRLPDDSEPDNDGEVFSFELADLGEEKPESEDK